MTINALSSMIALLRADTVVTAEVGSVTVYRQTLPAITGEIDKDWAQLMPRRMVLVREAGGLEKTGVGPLSWPRFDVRCYGKGARRAVWDASELSCIIYERLFARHNMATGLVAITLNAGTDARPRSRIPDGPIIYARMTCCKEARQWLKES